MNEESHAMIKLREVEKDDLQVFYKQQLDPEAIFMAAFTAKDPADWEGFQIHWARILGDESIIIRTILFEGHIAGHILSHAWFGEREVSYWLGREFWGKGIATQALAAFLEIIEPRPLYARVVKDNVASVRVLEKCGFRISGEDRGFSNARGREVEEYILRID